MSSAAELRRRIESCKIHHPVFQNHYEWLSQRIEDALEGFSPRIEWIVAPSRAGKSMLMEALAEDHPPTRIDGVRQVPVLYMALTPGVSPKSFPALIQQALKVPVRTKGKTSELLEHVCDQLNKTRTKVLLLDEASHFVEPSARVLPRAAGDMLKSLSDGANLSIVMSGIPRLQLLIDSNDQLRQRAVAKRVLNPYDFSNAHQLRDFVQCVTTYADMFAQSGWPIEVDRKAFVQNCYLHTGGLVGALSKYMRELCTRKRGEAPRPLTFEDCTDASARAGGTRHPLIRPFESELVSDANLNQAHRYILEADALPQIRRH